MAFRELATSTVIAVLVRAIAAQSDAGAPAQPAVFATPGRPGFVGDSADPAVAVTVTPPDDDPVPDLEWTALGDSYASGVGSSDYVDGQRCLRYDESYPIIVNWNPEYPPDVEVLPPGYHKLNNVVCSGAEAQDIIDWQLLDEPTSGQPNWQFGSRPAFGAPEFATLTAGGDDIDFPGILFNCILGAHVPGGPPHRSCTDQKAHTWSLLNDGGFIGEVTRVIDAIMTKGQAQEGEKGENFRLYVTGYARFFNADTGGEDTNCEGTTFNIDGLWNGNPLGPNGAEDARLTKEQRMDFNNMADKLNDGVQQAVDDYNNAHDPANPRVEFVDIQIDDAGQDIMSGHRFCEPGVQEPDPNNDQLYFFHYPYSTTNAGEDDQAQLVFETAWNQTLDEAGGDTATAYPSFNGFFNAVFDNITPDLVYSSGIPDYTSTGLWGSIGIRTRVFHPQFAWHDRISAAVLAHILLNQGDPGVGEPGPQEPDDGTLDPIDTDLGILTCNVQHDDGDEEWYFDLDTGNQAIADFCSAAQSAGTQLGSQTSAQVGGIIVSATANDNQDGCPPLDVTADTFVDTCTERLSVALNGCDTTKRESDLWKQGGTFYRDCVTWTLGLKSPF